MSIYWTYTKNITLSEPQRKLYNCLTTCQVLENRTSRITSVILIWALRLQIVLTEIAWNLKDMTGSGVCEFPTLVGVQY